MNQVNQTSTAIVSPIAIGKPGADLLSGRDFLSFVWKEKVNRRYLWITLVGSIIQFIILKLLFPFPDFISDSYNYIQSAIFHLNVNLWPIGYAKFLWLVHKIHYSDTFLLATQYAILQSALLYFFYTIACLLRPSRVSLNILFFFLLFNPLFLYMSNCVLSDALFNAITIVWLAQLMWQIFCPRMYHVIVSAVLIGLAFTIRYTAIYYPIIMGLGLLLSRQNPWIKLAGTLAPLMLMIPFVQFTKVQTKAVTGTAEFSVFGGWQIANNALYMYDHIDVDPQQLPPGSVKLDSMVKKYYSTAPDGWFNFEDFPGTFFIKHSDAPLKQYMYKYYEKEADSSSFLAWGKVSPMYNAYGTYLIKHYPFSFARYYMLLNAKLYFNPFLEKYGSYNVGTDEVDDWAQYWFHYKTTKVRVVSRSLLGTLFYVYPSVFLVLNIFFTGIFIWLLASGKWKHLSPSFKKILWLTAGFLLVNFGFSVFATPVVLRYQVIPFALLFIFTWLLLEFTDSKYIKPSLASKKVIQLKN